MKKIILNLFAFGLLVSLNACRDESLNPLPGWEPGVHGWGVFDGVAETNKANTANYVKNLAATNQASSKVDFKIRWVSLDNKLTVNKVEILAEMVEYYNDAEGNPKSAALGKKVVGTIASPTGNRQWNSFSITGQQLYDAFKDATVKYDKVNAVKVFANPANPRPAGRWFSGATDDFVVTWKLYTSDGKVFDTWNGDSVCADPTPLSEASANCSLTFSVK